jgi:Fe-Mn family superoxide dismutase
VPYPAQAASFQTLERHCKLYKGSVNETNRLTERIVQFLKNGQVDRDDEMPAYSKLTRRLSFECNGMVLHGYYFDNLTKHERGAG